MKQVERFYQQVGSLGFNQKKITKNVLKILRF